MYHNLETINCILKINKNESIMNYTRSELLNAEATMNQMRNAITHLARFMVKNGVSDVSSRLQRMGQNIAKTYIRYWKPINLVNTSNIKDAITTIYKNVVNSTVSIVLDEKESTIVVTDARCSLCKYQYDDIKLAGCDILVGLIAEFINLINKESKNSSAIYLKPLKVAKSRGYGNSSCVQLFKYKVGGA